MAISLLCAMRKVLKRIALLIYKRATVVERPHVWYQDDGQLTKRICPEMPKRTRMSRPNRVPSNHHAHEQSMGQKSEMDKKVRRNHGMIKPEFPDPTPRASGSMFKNMPLGPTQQPRSSLPLPLSNETVTVPRPTNPTNSVPVPTASSKCCACDEAKYEVRFEGIWSKETHPKDFPENEWLLHFSDIIGASHSPDYVVWKAGDVASEGIRQVAEWGATRHLETELKSKVKRKIMTVKYIKYVFRE